MLRAMQVIVLTLGPFASNCYIVANERSGEAMVIDPGSEPETILDNIARLRARVVAYPLTHGHIDHVYALVDVYKRHPAPVGLHAKDAAWAFSERNLIPPFPAVPRRPPVIERSWEEGQAWTDAGLTYRVIECPGHSPGGVSFHFPKEGVLFSGDTLFEQSVGRTDLPGGDARLLAHSLKKLMALPDDTVVYPGHGPETTVGAERRANPFVKGWGVG
jgi:glyoxylase-like metal-dependent hydrolase (beta-lactamase superfamily II)